MKDFNMVLVGVGGQGILLAAEILGTAAVNDGLNVRVSEIHGMAQRGGSVVSTLRIGEKVCAPTVLDGRADILLGFEQLETLRNLKYASEKTTVIMGNERIPPTEWAARNTEYPDTDDIIRMIHQFTKLIIRVEATKLAEKTGNRIVQNTVLVGVAAGTGRLPIKKQSITKALRGLVPQKHLQLNVKAFEAGYHSVKE
jgi:indolepyruvate ferredoxin oxidoreductase beta subunit